MNINKTYHWDQYFATIENLDFTATFLVSQISLSAASKYAAAILW